MSNRFEVPTDKSIAELLDALFGSEVKVSDGPVIEPADAYIANYICDEDKNVAVCVADTAMVAYSGSIMMMIPVGGANDAIESKELSDVMQECYYEVVNILSRSLMSSTSDHLRLDKVFKPGDNTDIVAGLGGEVDVVSYTVEIPGYGPGHITFTTV